MSAPLIAVSAAVSPADGSRPERVSLNSAYLRAIADAGGLPVVLAPSVRPATIIGLLSSCSGLMLTGGGDLFPGLYGEDPHPKTAGVSVERDRMEVEALGWALERKRPILAICRGMQVLNVALGGSLYQDLPEQHPSEVNHAQTAGGAHGRAAATHAVRIAPGSGLAALLGGCDLMTNSMHHQALKVLGAGVTAVGHAADGVVEAIEMPWANDGCSVCSGIPRRWPPAKSMRVGCSGRSWRRAATSSWPALSAETLSRAS